MFVARIVLKALTKSHSKLEYKSKIHQMIYAISNYYS